MLMRRAINVPALATKMSILEKSPTTADIVFCTLSESDTGLLALLAKKVRPYRRLCKRWF